MPVVPALVADGVVSVSCDIVVIMPVVPALVADGVVSVSCDIVVITSVVPALVADALSHRSILAVKVPSDCSKGVVVVAEDCAKVLTAVRSMS